MLRFFKDKFGFGQYQQNAKDGLKYKITKKKLMPSLCLTL